MGSTTGKKKTAVFVDADGAGSEDMCPVYCILSQRVLPGFYSLTDFHECHKKQ